MNNAGGATRHPRGEVILFDQQRVFSRPCTLPRNGDTIDAAANHHHLKVLALQACSGICR
jgi:hypothetical protein